MPDSMWQERRGKRSLLIDERCLGNPLLAECGVWSRSIRGATRPGQC